MFIEVLESDFDNPFLVSELQKLEKVLATPVIAPYIGPTDIRQLLLHAFAVQVRMVYIRMSERLCTLTVKSVLLKEKNRAESKDFLGKNEESTAVKEPIKVMETKEHPPKEINQYEGSYLRAMEAEAISVSANKQAQEMLQSGCIEYRRGFADGLNLLEDRNEALYKLHTWMNIRQE